MNDPASALSRRLANRMLADEQWAREKLKAHAGRSFAVACGPLSGVHLITPDGTLDALPTLPGGAGARADAELVVSPWQVPSFLADPGRWDALVTRQGDAALVATLKELAQTLPWFVERGFANVFGPIVGQRLADAGRSLLAFPEYASSHAAASMKSYVRDEAGVVARGDEASGFSTEIAHLAVRVDTLAGRVDALAAASGTRAQN